MRRKLLLFDLDGTLLTSDETITPCSIRAIEACKAEGMLVGYVTGRARTTQYEMENGKIFLTDKYNLPKDFAAYYNGAEIYAGGIPIESNTIPHENAMDIIRALDSAYPNAKIGVRHEPWSYLKRSGRADGENWNVETGEKVKCGILELPSYGVQRIRIEFDEQDDKSRLNGIVTGEAAFFVNVDGSAMIIHKNATKERAAKKASEYFGIPLADIISFGDDINDANMLKISGVGVAMGNAVEAAKEAADHITETNDSEGIAVWIDKYLSALYL